MNTKRAILVLAAAALVATGVWLGVAHAGGKGGTRPEKGVQHAIVSSSGGLYLGSKDAVSAIRNSTGSYTVHFRYAIDNCALVATLQDANGYAVASADDPAGLGSVDVNPFNDTGTAIDSNFSLVVAC
jgi:hypothetical protein